MCCLAVVFLPVISSWISDRFVAADWLLLVMRACMFPCFPVRFDMSQTVMAGYRGRKEQGSSGYERFCSVF